LRLIAKQVGCIDRGGAPVDRVIPDLYRNAMLGLELDEQEQSLFLLGILVARVASEQYRSDQSGTKPILEKLNYTGMSLPRVTVFATELFDKLRQYRLLSGPGAAENELLYAEALQRLTRQRSRWRLSDAENVYFILAGYSYETGRIIQAGKEKRAQEQEPVEELSH
jgi:CRISPR-associated protein Csh1